MNIKNLKPNKKGRFKQGYYNISESKKYVGNNVAIYRSSWEFKFMNYAESNPNIINWSSEPFAVRYFNILDKKYHTYYPDYYVKVKRGEIFEECVIELKPKDQLKKPKLPKVNSLKAMNAYKYAAKRYVTNLCKIEALKKFAAERNMKLILLTEDSWII